MKTKLFTTALLALLLSAPVSASLTEEMAALPESENVITMTVSGSNVRVCGAEGETLDIYNLAGVKVKSIRIDSDDKSLALSLSKGCYILKIGDVARKMSIR